MSEQSQWYMSRIGVISGPFRFDEILRLYRLHQILPIDFLASTSTGSATLTTQLPEWRLAIEYPELKAIGSADGEWTLLRNQRLLGPFATADVLELLSRGDVSYSDLASPAIDREGSGEWRRIGDVEQFDRRTPFKSTLAQTPLPVVEDLSGVASESLLANVARVQRIAQVNTKIRSEYGIDELDAHSGYETETPPEATGPDLATLPVRAMSMASKLILIIVPTLFCAPLVRAERLEVVPLKLATSEPLLIIRTDSPVGAMIEVDLRRVGDAEKSTAFKKHFTLKREAGELPTIELAEMDLPPGSYSVLAKIGAKSTSTTFFRGEKLDSEHLQKQNSRREQKDTKALFYATRKVQDYLAAVAEKRTDAGALLRKAKQILLGQTKAPNSSRSGIAASLRELVKDCAKIKEGQNLRAIASVDKNHSSNAKPDLSELSDRARQILNTLIDKSESGGTSRP